MTNICIMRVIKAKNTLSTCIISKFEHWKHETFCFYWSMRSLSTHNVHIFWGLSNYIFFHIQIREVSMKGTNNVLDTPVLYRIFYLENDWSVFSSYYSLSSLSSYILIQIQFALFGTSKQFSIAFHVVGFIKQQNNWL